MYPSPARSKACLPPKKRESRQASSDQLAQEDDFKPPAPHRRHHYSATKGSRESGVLQPPPLPMLPPHPLSFPWPVSYGPSMHHSQVGERRGIVSSSWSGTMCKQGMDGRPDHRISHHSPWLCNDNPPLNLQPFISLPTFKNVYTGKSREMWPYSQSQREYNSSFSSSLFSQPTIYPHDTLPDTRLSYQVRQPNNVDGPAGRSGSSRRVPFCNEYRNDSMTSLDGPYGIGRRRQEDTAGQSTGKGPLTQESTGTHSIPRDRDPWGTPKAPTPPSSDAKEGKAIDSQDHYSGSASEAEAQIYYALGSLCPSAQQNPQAQLSSSKPPSCLLRNLLPSPHSQQISHEAETEWDASAGFYHPAVTVLTGPDPHPSTVLPHFAKGSLIELASGCLKRVEELKMKDFLHSADTLREFHLSTCTILLISPGQTHSFNYLQVQLTDHNTQEVLTVLAEYPFFVRDHGWSSCSPQRSAQLYGLQCRQLSTGDVFLALTPTATSRHSITTLVHSSNQVQHSLSRSEAGAVTCTDTAKLMPQVPPLPVAQPSPPSPRGECPCTRKRHRSAPELQLGCKTSSHLPQGSKHKSNKVHGYIQSP